MNHKRQRRGQGGQALVEFALILPVLVLILMLIFDFGRALYTYSVIGNAAREGAWTGAMRNGTDAEIRTAARRLAIGLDPIPDGDITITPPGTRTYGGTVTVNVTYDFEAVTPLIDQFFPGGRLTLASSATMDVR